MRKNRIRLTESQLHRVIKESIRNVLKEGYEPYSVVNLTRYRPEGNGFGTGCFPFSGSFEECVEWFDSDEFDTTTNDEYAIVNDRDEIVWRY